MSDRETLLEFGFSPEVVDRALKATNHGGLQSALDWLEKHGDDPEETHLDTNTEELNSASKDQLANSLKCLECGKIFANESLASWHGEKSGHSQFEESTDTIAPLTAEEKASRLNELRTKMEAKRKAKALQDAEDSKKNEAIRRKGGKDMSKLKEDMHLKEADKEAAQRKRDKIEADKAKARVLKEIEADKKARAERAAIAKSNRDGSLMPSEGLSATPQQGLSANPNFLSTPNKTYPEARLQIRLPNGEALVRTQPSETTLKSVIDWLLQQPTTVMSGLTERTIKLSTTFPRRVFTEAEMNESLAKLELAPSAVLVVIT